MNDQDFSIPQIDCFACPYFFFSTNKKNELLYVSPSVEQVLGYAPDELIGRKYSDFLDANSPLNKDMSECRKKRFRGDGVHERLRVFETSDDKLKVLKVQTHGVRNSHGKIVANHGIAQDVTDVYFSESELHSRLVRLRSAESRLTAREKNVVGRVVRGQLNKVIAKELMISLRAVERIRAQAIVKFNVDTIAEVISMVAELEVLTDVVLLAQGAKSSTAELTESRVLQRSCC